MLWVLTVGHVPVNKSAPHLTTIYRAFGDVKFADAETTDNSSGLDRSASAVVKFRKEK